MVKLSKVIQKQKPMTSVVLALLPLTVASVYFFGWRSIAVLAVVNVVGFLSEYIFTRVYKTKVSAAVFVTNFLFALSLPPTIPFWMAGVGIAFGVVFGKMVFGGFGRNIFNPAISGRAFIYVSFGYELTSGFMQPVQGLFPKGFAAWLPSVDTLTKATPLVNLASGESVSNLSLFLGNVPGSFGETSALLIILGGIYLVWKKVANFRMILGTIFGFLGMSAILWLSGVQGVADPLSWLLAGSILYVSVFMVTDPVSASQTTNGGRWIYGAFIGVITVLIRAFSVWPEGVTFAVLLGNMFAPLLDLGMKSLKKKRKEKAAS